MTAGDHPHRTVLGTITAGLVLLCLAHQVPRFETPDRVALDSALVRATARARRVPAPVIAGVVLAEHHFNVTLVDRVQDRVLRAWLAHHSDDWWAAWAARGEREALRAKDARWLANKWPATLVASGYVASFGPAQLTPRTVLRGCAEVVAPPCDAGVKEVLQQMLSADGAIALVGVVLDFEAREWEKHSHTTARRDVGLLATLYSTGGDYYVHRHISLTQLPIRNAFGRWVEERCGSIAIQLGSNPAECGPPLP